MFPPRPARLSPKGASPVRYMLVELGATTMRGGWGTAFRAIARVASDAQGRCPSRRGGRRAGLLPESQAAFREGA